MAAPCDWPALALWGGPLLERLPAAALDRPLLLTEVPAGGKVRGEALLRRHCQGSLRQLLEAPAGAPLYLAQCRILGRSEDGAAEDLPGLPAAFLELGGGQQGATANLWLARTRTATNVHYDSYEGLLAVARGRKVVEMAPPDAPAALRGAYPAHAEDAQHSSVADADWRPTAVADVGPGQMVRIPEGWWHRVRSEPDAAGVCLAINVWTPGGRAALPAASPYLCRALFRSLVDARMDLSAPEDSGGLAAAPMDAARAAAARAEDLTPRLAAVIDRAWTEAGEERVRPVVEALADEDEFVEAVLLGAAAYREEVARGVVWEVLGLSSAPVPGEAKRRRRK